MAAGKLSFDESRKRGRRGRDSAVAKEKDPVADLLEGEVDRITQVVDVTANGHKAPLLACTEEGFDRAHGFANVAHRHDALLRAFGDGVKFIQFVGIFVCSDLEEEASRRLRFGASEGRGGQKKQTEEAKEG